MIQHQESHLRQSAGDSGNVGPPDLPDGLFADDEACGEPSITNGDAENDFIVNKPTGDEECQPQRVLKDPGMPSQKDIDEHEAGGHATYRALCEACVEGRRVGEPHLRGKKQESKIPILAFDYLFATSGGDIKTREDITPPEAEGCKLKILVATDTTSASIFSHVVEKKGVEDDRCSVDKLVEDTEWLDYSLITSRATTNQPLYRC